MRAAILAGTLPTTSEPTKPQAQPVQESTAEHNMLQFPGLDPGLLRPALSYRDVHIEHRDITITLSAISVSIEESQIGLLLPATMRVEMMKLKSKFMLRVDDAEYSVMYLGGNFTFNSTVPPLRVLSFMRLSDTLPK